MMRLTIREAAEAKGISTAYQLQKALNVPPGTAARLWRGEMRMIALSTLDALCEALGCELSELITREVGQKKKRK
jgi:DNA-binding Xre family transcriptional regulator